MLNETLKIPRAGKKKVGSWRSQDALFFPDAEEISPGLLNFSPAWFQQGHEVCFIQFVTG